MKRREFITLLGSAAASWPLAVNAQQPERTRRVGVLMGGAESDQVNQARLAAFLDGLQQLGWTDGRNVRIDIRWPAASADRNRTYAAELVELAPDVILASASASVAALRPRGHWRRGRSKQRRRCVGFFRSGSAPFPNNREKP